VEFYFNLVKSHPINVMVLGCFNHHGYLSTDIFEDPVDAKPLVQRQSATRMGFGMMARLVQYALGYYSFSYKTLIEADKKVNMKTSVPDEKTSYIKYLKDLKDKGSLPHHVDIRILLEHSISSLSSNDWSMLQCILKDLWCLQPYSEFPDVYERNGNKFAWPGVGLTSCGHEDMLSYDCENPDDKGTATGEEEEEVDYLLRMAADNSDDDEVDNTRKVINT